MKAHSARWITDRRIDGVRVDSIANVKNWDFVGEFTAYARQQYRHRWAAATGASDDAAADERFLVVGEELSMPRDLVAKGYVDALWNEWFKRAIRQAILGHNAEDEPSFEWTVRKLIDPRNLRYSGLTQLVNYITSHDVAGFRNERLQNFLRNNGVRFTADRIKLAFTCLLTAAGIPMILAGEEFADEHDLPITDEDKQIDPVNYSRLDDPWRKDVHEHVRRLIHLRTTSDALAVVDTTFLHVDFDDGKRVLVWQRGSDTEADPVVVVANFSDWASASGTDYIVPPWPQLPVGREWFEVTTATPAPAAGRDPISPWCARVYRPH
jgi:1,4-alpha-glucan branching enzyme